MTSLPFDEAGLFGMNCAEQLALLLENPFWHGATVDETASGVRLAADDKLQIGEAALGRWQCLARCLL